jgi:hypothetical protein
MINENNNINVKGPSIGSTISTAGGNSTQTHQVKEQEAGSPQ